MNLGKNRKNEVWHAINKFRYSRYGLFCFMEEQMSHELYVYLANEIREKALFRTRIRNI